MVRIDHTVIYRIQQMTGRHILKLLLLFKRVTNRGKIKAVDTQLFKILIGN